MGKSPQFDVDRARSQMSPEDLQQFDHFCRFNPSYRDIQRQLQELGYQVSMSAIQAWYTTNYPVGEEAKAINALAAAYVGADPLNCLQMSVAATVTLTDRLLSQVSERLFVEASPENILHTLASSLKEQRTAAIALHNLTTIRDKKALELAGGYRLAEILQRLADDTPSATMMQEFCEAALSQLEQEVKNSTT
jgi:hypothetical protein